MNQRAQSTPATQSLRDAIRIAGGLERFSRRFDIQPGHLRAVLEGRTQPGKRTLRAIDLAGVSVGRSLKRVDAPK